MSSAAALRQPACTARRRACAAPGRLAAAVFAAGAALACPATAAPPQRIVTLLPSLTETVCALGACERLVGTDRYSNWPAAVRALPKLGGLDDAQLEHIVALKPDLVLTSGSARVAARLQGMGIAVLALEADSLADMRRVTEQVAQALGQPGAGLALAQRVDAQIAEAATRVPAALRGQRVYFEIDSAPYAAGEKSFVGELLARLGLANIVPAALGPFPKLNPEFVVRAQPDLVMAEQAELAKMPGRPGWGGLRALREHRECGFSTARYELLIRPGPRTGEAADLVVQCLVGLNRPATAAPLR